jgi:hypothetical protein
MPNASTGVRAPVHKAEKAVCRLLSRRVTIIIQIGWLQFTVGVESAVQNPSISNDTGDLVNKIRVARLMRRQSAKISIAARAAEKTWTAV